MTPVPPATSAKARPTASAAEWDAWLTAWEEWLAACLALASSSDPTTPAVPVLPQPAGAPPRSMHDRFVRAAALRVSAIDLVRERMAQIAHERSGPRGAYRASAPAAPVASHARRGDLDL